MKLTSYEKNLLWEMVKTHIDWGEGGCLLKDEGDTSLVDEDKIKVAKKILEKIKNG